MVYCADCGDDLPTNFFTNNQLRKYSSRCIECITGNRVCAECGDQCNSGWYSSNQWFKGSGESRCKECVGFVCNTCKRVFGDANQLKMHQQVHRPRDVACPVCGERRFRSGANAVQHVESGHCTGCRGQDNARTQIYKFAQSKSAMKPYMDRLLTNGEEYGVPDKPYSCPECDKHFHHLSQLLQHQDQKHNNHRLLSN